jgi:hypothetical protein
MRTLKFAIQTTLMLLVTNLVLSQEIKIKKGVLLLDGAESALMEKKKNVYSFSNLKNEAKFSVELKSRLLLDGTNAYWCILTDLATNKTNEILDRGTYEGLSFEKTIVSSVVHGDKKFITTNGIDEKLVSEFINGDKSNVLKDFDNTDLKIKTDITTEKANLDNYKIRVEKGNILQKQKITDKDGREVVADVLVGSIVRKEEVIMQGFAPSVYYAVSTIEPKVDERGKKYNEVKVIANWYKSKIGYDNPVTGKKINQQIITEDKKSFNLSEIHPDNSAEALNTTFGKPDENKLKEAIVAKLLFNGYGFGKEVVN